jgi:hypothetical protein
LDRACLLLRGADLVVGSGPVGEWLLKLNGTDFCGSSEPLIALDIEDMLNRAKYANLTLLTTFVADHEYLAHNTPSAAVVDICLKDGDCTE